MNRSFGGLRAGDEFVEAHRPAIDLQGHPRSRSAEESEKVTQLPGRVLAADRRPFFSGTWLDVGDQRQDLVEPVGSGSFDLGGGENSDARGGLQVGTRNAFARHDDFVPITRVAARLVLRLKRTGNGQQQTASEE